MKREQRQQILHDMGIDVWSLQEKPDNSVPTHDWSYLENAVENCQECGLAKTRTNTVFGVGSREAKLMVIGEAPGKDEDLQGKPFVGPAGKLLDAMLQAVDLSRNAVFIGNILKCRPPDNRDPEMTEIDKCFAYLEQQITLVDPRVILCVGRIAAQKLLDTGFSIGRLRGKVHQYGKSNIPLIVTYHPAYLLRKPTEKSKSWQDLQLTLRSLS